MAASRSIRNIACPASTFSTGSLGHGICLAVGAVLGARLQATARRVYTLISDAECNDCPEVLVSCAAVATYMDGTTACRSSHSEIMR